MVRAVLPVRCVRRVLAALPARRELRHGRPSGGRHSCRPARSREGAPSATKAAVRSATTHLPPLPLLCSLGTAITGFGPLVAAAAPCTGAVAFSRTTKRAARVGRSQYGGRSSLRSEDADKRASRKGSRRKFSLCGSSALRAKSSSTPLTRVPVHRARPPRPFGSSREEGVRADQPQADPHYIAQCSCIVQPRADGASRSA